MSVTSIQTEAPAASKTRSGILNSVARSALLGRLSDLAHGEIILRDSEGERVFGIRTNLCPISVTIDVDHNDFYSLVAFEGSIGAGESYMHGHWRCSSLTDLVRIFVLNREVLDRMDSGLAAISKPVLKAIHALRKNTRSGSRRNIAAHYDLGNDFYSLFLDETMAYSAAYFETGQHTLAEASRAKFDRICRKLDLQPTDHLLEIGTGWGGFAIHAAKQYGCRVTTTTISREQYEFARQAIADAGLDNRITLLCEDYRDLRGQFDKIVSIEMIEAVGTEYYGTFFRKCASLLADDGMLVLQAITIQDQEYERARKSVDFIQRFIFPGGCLPSVTALCDSARRHSDLKLFHFEDASPHYARTLREWRKRFLEKREDVKALGFSNAFIRMWEFYLCYCEGGFIERNIASAQLVFTRPLCRTAPILGALS